MIDDSTLGGYFERHDRPPAFEGSDGKSYSVDLYVDSEPDPEGRFGGAILFVRWSDGGDIPVGHLETENLVRGLSRADAEGQLRLTTLHELKTHLDRLIEHEKARPDW